MGAAIGGGSRGIVVVAVVAVVAVVPEGMGGKSEKLRHGREIRTVHFFVENELRLTSRAQSYFHGEHLCLLLLGRDTERESEREKEEGKKRTRSQRSIREKKRRRKIQRES